MDELIEFLLARTAEDEMFARVMRAVGRDVHLSGKVDADALSRLLDAVTADPRAGAIVAMLEQGGEAPNTLDRILAECEGRRAIIKQCEEILHFNGWDFVKFEFFAESVLRELGLPFVGHPDYREEWRP